MFTARGSKESELFMTEDEYSKLTELREQSLLLASYVEQLQLRPLDVVAEAATKRRTRLVATQVQAGISWLLEWLAHEEREAKE